MEIKRIQNSLNYTSPQKSVSFQAGVSGRLKRLLSQNDNSSELYEKIASINKVNKPYFQIEDAVYNAKSKVAEFFLNGTESITSIIGLKSVKPQKITVAGESLSDAFMHIDENELRNANSVLQSRYSDQYEKTRPLREQAKQEQDRFYAKIQKTFEEMIPSLPRNPRV